MHYVYLVIAIAMETIGTTALQASQQFTRPGPSFLVAVTYGASFYFLALSLKVLPIGIAYAIWSGLGIVFIAAIGFVVFQQRLDMAALLGIALIMAGIVVINLFSGTTRH